MLLNSYIYLYFIGDAASCPGLCTGRVFHPAQWPVERAPAYSSLLTGQAIISITLLRPIFSTFHTTMMVVEHPLFKAESCVEEGQAG